MTVYVDDMRMQATVGKLSSRWSHLTADTPEELLAFALKLGLRQSWVQYPGTYKEHYDLTEGMRQRALRNGATAITIQEAGALLKAKREKIRDSKPAN
jgi:hypothetical protein